MTTDKPAPACAQRLIDCSWTPVPQYVTFLWWKVTLKEPLWQSPYDRRICTEMQAATLERRHALALYLFRWGRRTLQRWRQQRQRNADQRHQEPALFI